MTIESGLTATTSLLQLAPSILQLIMMMEQVFKNTQNSGVQKKALVLSTIPTETKVEAGKFIDDTITSLNSVSQVTKV